MTTRGFLLGKFLPPHAGHVFLGQFARHHCDELTILVCSLPREPIPGALRYAWMRELFPTCRVLHHDADVPQEPSEHADFWPIWRRIVTAAHPEPIDFVYASEPYGARLAAEVGARFVPVDLRREALPVSGTLIRREPFRHWRFIPAPVRPWFVRTACVLGPDAADRAALAGWLATRFDTVHVADYARTDARAFGPAATASDWTRIARGRRAAVAAAAREANRILILDLAEGPEMAHPTHDAADVRIDLWLALPGSPAHSGIRTVPLVCDPTVARREAERAALDLLNSAGRDGHA